MASPEWMYDELTEVECEECEETFVADVRTSICPQCQEEAFHRSMAKSETPEGGWPRNSQMDRL